MKTYFVNVLICIDLLASAILGGKPGETLSGRAGSAYLQGKLRGRIFAPCINFIMRNPNHCVGAISGDIGRAKAVILDQEKK